jgi:hypothetical protein
MDAQIKKYMEEIEMRQGIQKECVLMTENSKAIISKHIKKLSRSFT